MSVTILIAGKQATLADRQWRSADAGWQELLTTQLRSLELPAHYPPGEVERLIAEAAVREIGARTIDCRPIPDDPSRMLDGRLRVY